MKKFISVFLLFALITLSGCNGSSGAKNVQEKLEQAGYSIEMDKYAGTKVAYINLTLGEDDIFSICIIVDKDREKVDLIDYKMSIEYAPDKTYVDSVSYGVDERINFGIMEKWGETVCLGYDLDKGSYIDDAYSKAGDGCDEIEIESLLALKESRDEWLKKLDITLDDLESFGNWYYSTNK